MDVSDETNSARVVFVGRVVQSLRSRLTVHCGQSAAGVTAASSLAAIPALTCTTVPPAICERMAVKDCGGGDADPLRRQAKPAMADCQRSRAKVALAACHFFRFALPIRPYVDRLVHILQFLRSPKRLLKILVGPCHAEQSTMDYLCWS